jgi:hypothetical protein
MTAKPGDMAVLWTWPLEMWRFGTAMMETMTGAQRVISARLPVIAEAMRDPLSADHRELTRMVSEKVTAFGVSGRSAVAAGETVRRAATANAQAMGRLAGGGMLWFDDWMRLAQGNIAAAAALTTLPATALAPLHAGVKANDKRLRR